MTFAVNPLSITPVRAAPAGKSELLTQMLFGECAEVIEFKGKNWVKVRCITDNVIGCVRTGQLRTITPTEQDDYRAFWAFALDVLHPVMSAEMSRPITIGARLPLFDGLRCSLGEERLNYSGQAVFPQDMRPSAALIIKFARRYLHAPYLHGGRSPFGIDAGALVQLVFGFTGILLPRFPAEQVTRGRTVDFVQQAQPGDIAFFEKRSGVIRHAGILLPEGRIIHAFEQVRIDRIDHYGIYNENLQKYTHKLRIVRRFLENQPQKTEAAKADDAVPVNQIGLF